MLIWVDILNQIHNIHLQQLQIPGIKGDVSDIVTLRWKASSNSSLTNEVNEKSENLGIQRDEECSNVKTSKTILLILLEVSLHSMVTVWSCTTNRNQYTNLTLWKWSQDSTKISFLPLCCNSSLMTNTFWDLNIYTTKLYKTNVGILWRKLYQWLAQW
jgi:hypothetical protein